MAKCVRNPLKAGDDLFHDFRGVRPWLCRFWVREGEAEEVRLEQRVEHGCSLVASGSQGGAETRYSSKANPSDLLAPPSPALEILSNDELIMKLKQSWSTHLSVVPLQCQSRWGLFIPKPEPGPSSRICQQGRECRCPLLTLGINPSTSHFSFTVPLSCR